MNAPASRPASVHRGPRRHRARLLARSRVAAAARQPPRLPGSLQTNRKLDAWVRINADGSATVFTGKVELGQGILTALAQIAAEELDLPLARITMISGDTGQTPNEGQTAGSQSIENSGTALAPGRRGGARDPARSRRQAARRRAATSSRSPTASSRHPTAAR